MQNFTVIKECIEQMEKHFALVCSVIDWYTVCRQNELQRLMGIYN